MPELRHPSEFELAILRVLWRRNTATVREVFEELQGERQLVYNTALKTMLILLEKGLVQRDVSNRSHVYRALQGERETQAVLLRDLLQRAFGGAGREFVLAAIQEAPLLPEDAAAIREFTLLRSMSNNPKDLRAFPRMPLGRGARVKLRAPTRASSRAENISMGGLLLGPTPAMPAGAACEFAVAGSPDGGRILLKGLVIRSDERGTAIRFTPMLDANTYQRIINHFPLKGASPRFSA